MISAQLDRILKILEVLDGDPLSSMAIAEQTSLPARTIRSDLQRLLREGLVERAGAGPKTRWSRTQKGESLLLQQQQLASKPQAELPLFLNHLPEHLRAFFSLIFYAIIAEPHVRKNFPKGRPGFFLFGPKKTGKTTLFEQFGPLLGLQREEFIIASYFKTGKESTMRRKRVKAGYSVEVSPYFERPLVVFDDLHWAETKARKEILKLFHGEQVVEIEGERIETKSIPALILNTNKDLSDLYQFVDEPYLRRGFILNTWPIRSSLKGLPGIFRQLSGRVDPWSIKQFQSPATLSDHGHDFVQQTLESALTETGYGSMDDLAVQFCILGAIPLHGGDELLASHAVLRDALLCWETMPDYVRPDWRQRLHAAYLLASGGSDAGAQPSAGGAERAQPGRVSVEQERLSEYTAQANLISERTNRAVVVEEWLERMEQLAGLSKEWERKSRSLRERLQFLLASIQEAGSQETLEELNDLMEQCSVQVRELVEDYLAKRDTTFWFEVQGESARIAKRHQPLIDNLQSVLSRNQEMNPHEFVKWLVQVGCLRPAQYQKLKIIDHPGWNDVVNVGVSLMELFAGSAFTGIDGKSYMGNGFTSTQKAWPLIRSRLDSIRHEIQLEAEQAVQARWRLLPAHTLNPTPEQQLPVLAQVVEDALKKPHP